VTWATPDASQHGVDLYDLYKINTTWPTIATPAGHWDRKDGLIYNITSFKYLRRGNLHRLNFDSAIAVKQSRRFMEGFRGFTAWGTRTNLRTYHRQEVRVSFLTSAREVEYEEFNPLKHIVYYACYLTEKNSTFWPYTVLKCLV
jgi:hypothetical protein